MASRIYLPKRVLLKSLYLLCDPNGPNYLQSERKLFWVDGWPVATTRLIKQLRKSELFNQDSRAFKEDEVFLGKIYRDLRRIPSLGVQLDKFTLPSEQPLPTELSTVSQLPEEKQEGVISKWLEEKEAIETKISSGSYKAIKTDSEKEQSQIDKKVELKANLNTAVSTSASKIASIGQRIIHRFPIASGSVFAALPGAIIGSTFGPRQALLGAVISGSIPGLSRTRLGAQLLRGGFGLALRGVGAAAALTTPAGWALLAASLLPQGVKKAPSHLLKIIIAIGVAFIVIMIMIPLGLLESTSYLMSGITNTPPPASSGPGSTITTGQGCPDTTGNRGSSCRYLNPSIDIYNTNIPQPAIDLYISKYSPVFTAAGIGDFTEFKKRINYIVGRSKQAGLNPAIFLGYWRTESLFSTYPLAADLGCAPGDASAKGFYNQVDCALALDGFNNWATECARGNMAKCNALQKMRSSNGQDSLHLIQYPIKTFDDLAEAYGPIAADPNNCSHTYNLLIDTIIELGGCQISTMSTIPVSTPNSSFTFFCQGNTSWQNVCSLGVAGCGPTSMAMLLSSFGLSEYNPVRADEAFQNLGFRSCGDYGSNMVSALRSSWLQNLGFEVGPNLVNGSSLNAGLAKQFLADKYLIAASSVAFPCANCRNAATVNHIFVVDEVTLGPGAVTVRVRDPNNCSYADGNDENPSKMLKNIDSFPWYYAYPIKKVR